MKSMHPFKSYSAETKSVKMTPTTTMLPTWMRMDNMIPMCLPRYAGDTNGPAKFQIDCYKTVGAAHTRYHGNAL